MSSTLISGAQSAVRRLNTFQWAAPLAMRLYFGYFWAETGWAKLHNLDGFAARFLGWGIAWPHLSATLSAGTEFVGGLLMMLGLLTRILMIPMIVNMLVAIVVVVLRNVHGLDDFVEIDEPLYVLIFFWLLLAGPGRVSLDAVLWPRMA